MGVNLIWIRGGGPKNKWRIPHFGSLHVHFEEIIGVLKQVEAGRRVKEVARELGVSERRSTHGRASTAAWRSTRLWPRSTQLQTGNGEFPGGPLAQSVPIKT